MKRALLITPLLLVIGSLPAQAQGSGQYAGTQCWINGKLTPVSGNTCPGTSSSGSSSSGVNSAAYSGLNQAGYQLGFALGQWLFGSGSNPQAELQKRLMMEELQRRQAEAERQHREEEARRLAAMYNRLSATLKLSGLPNLQLKETAGSGSGLRLKLGDNADGQAGIRGLPGIYLNDGKVPYGIPGLPGIYTGGPGQGSGLANSKLALKTGESNNFSPQGANGVPAPAGPNDNGPGTSAPNNSALATESGLHLKTGDSGGVQTTQATGLDPKLDPSKMTPQQLADVAEMVSKLPPEEQQRMLTVAQNDAAAGQPLPGTAGPSTQALASLQQQAAASQAAASASSLEDASAGARSGFDTPLGPREVQPTAGTTSSRALPSSQPFSPSLQTQPSAATATRERTTDSAARSGVIAPQVMTTQPPVTFPALAGLSPSPTPVMLPATTTVGKRHVESVGECLSHYAPTTQGGSAPSLEELHRKLELERGALEKLLVTQKRENEERNEWLKEMRKAAQDVALNAIDKGVEGLFDSSKEALQDTEIGLHEEIQEATKEARVLRQQMDEARKAAQADPARLASLQSQWPDMEKNQIQPLLEKRKALEGQWEKTFKWETRVGQITDARDFGAWLTDMELPCEYENDQVTCKNFKENNAFSAVAAGNYETGLDGLKLALKYAAHHAEQLKKLSNAAVIGKTAGKIAANATFVGEVWDTTSLMIDLSYDATVGILGYQRLLQVKQNDAQFERAKALLGARIDRMNAEASCYQNAN